MPNQYDFLNEYLGKVTADAGKSDPRADMDDDDDFYDTQSDEPEAEEDIEYGIANDDEDEEPANEQTNDDQDQSMDYLMGDDDADNEEIMGDGDDDETPTATGNSAGADVPEMTPAFVTAKRNNKLKSDISDVESGGKYSAFNPKGGGGGAVGKYQFRWNIWKDSIKSVTGIKSKDDFLKSPQAQEKFFSFYSKSYLKPQAEKLQQYNKAGLSMDQLQKLVHFRGETGAKKYLQGKLADKPEAYNMPISQYIGTKQTGGSAFYMNPTTRFQMGGVPIAHNASSQFQGLNDPTYHEMIFPMEGENTFRGLDSEEPVYLEDETGKKKVLKGRHQTTKMKGKVYEKRLK
jgi:hypothetical protein